MTLRQKRGWVGIDLDGTLAVHQTMEVWDGSIGPPVPAMLDFVKALLDGGVDVRIMTARVAVFEFADGDEQSRAARQVEPQRELIKAWCVEHLGRELPITCQKDYDMICLYDDRVIQVEHNTGRFIQPF